MGCTSSRVVSADQQHVIRRDVDELRGGDYPRDSFRYKLLLMNLHTLFEQQHFWTLPIDILTNYVSDLGLLQVKEAKQIAENIVKFSASTESDARDNLTRVLSVMRLEAKAGKEISKELFIRCETSLNSAEEAVLALLKEKKQAFRACFFCLVLKMFCRASL